MPAAGRHLHHVDVVVVTGCGQGIGRATFERLLGDGYRVLGVELDDGLANDAQTGAGSQAQVLTGDVADREVHGRAADEARSLGRLCGWVNNAAIQPRTNLHDPVPHDVERLLSVNLMGYYWGCSAAVRAMLAQGASGSIVNISSVHSRAGYSNDAAYDVSKGGVDALTRYVAVEYGPLGIRCNAVAPGGVRTPLFERLVASADDPEQTERDAIAPHPLRRIAEPHEIASVIAFLLSEEASFVTGQSIAADGGLSARCCDFPLAPGLDSYQLALGQGGSGS